MLHHGAEHTSLNLRGAEVQIRLLLLQRGGAFGQRLRLRRARLDGAATRAELLLERREVHLWRGRRHRRRRRRRDGGCRDGGRGGRGVCRFRLCRRRHLGQSSTGALLRVDLRLEFLAHALALRRRSLRRLLHLRALRFERLALRGELRLLLRHPRRELLLLQLHLGRLGGALARLRLAQRPRLRHHLLHLRLPLFVPRALVTRPLRGALLRRGRRCAGRNTRRGRSPGCLPGGLGGEGRTPRGCRRRGCRRRGCHCVCSFGRRLGRLRAELAVVDVEIIPHLGDAEGRRGRRRPSPRPRRPRGRGERNRLGGNAATERREVHRRRWKTHGVHRRRVVLGNARGGERGETRDAPGYPRREHAQRRGRRRRREGTPERGRRGRLRSERRRGDV